jgi:hypothetical protein
MPNWNDQSYERSTSSIGDRPSRSTVASGNLLRFRLLELPQVLANQTDAPTKISATHSGLVDRRAEI